SKRDLFVERYSVLPPLLSVIEIPKSAVNPRVQRVRRQSSATVSFVSLKLKEDNLVSPSPKVAIANPFSVLNSLNLGKLGDIPDNPQQNLFNDKLSDETESSVTNQKRRFLYNTFGENEKQKKERKRRRK
ncbi:unnamed protein product, partial [Didymodactylos carnosus]